MPRCELELHEADLLIQEDVVHVGMQEAHIELLALFDFGICIGNDSLQLVVDILRFIR